MPLTLGLWDWAALAQITLTDVSTSPSMHPHHLPCNVPALNPLYNQSRTINDMQFFGEAVIRLLLCGSNKIPFRPGFCMVLLWAVDHYMKINLIIHCAAETVASEAYSCKVVPVLRFQLMGARLGSSASAQPNLKRQSRLIHLSNKSDSGLQSTSSSEPVYWNKSREVLPFRAVILS